MASESPSTSPPAVAGRSFFIENLLNHSDNTKKEKHPDGLAGNISNYPFYTSSFSFVPRAVPQLSCDGLNFPLSTNLSKFNIGEMYYPHSVKFIGQFPVSNSRHPLGEEPFKIRRRRPMKKRKQRPLFSANQIEIMEKEYAKCRYVTESKRAELASDLNLTETQVKTWFQNRRTKSKREAQDRRKRSSSEIRCSPFEFCDRHSFQSDWRFLSREHGVHLVSYALSNPSYLPFQGRLLGL
ncbi:brain-specific homeobox protein homolog [Stylophora pistillata]|uniref:brain-specific homeobox protein homolog n=1 Tax=Stylophora pistillata TaxID=50429 RepID=UPI000C04448D|nr:brain-specific homeobox protein homolog [Stylophora pistillata]